jgi:hypothetical protein
MEEHCVLLSVIDNRVLKRIFAPKREKVTVARENCQVRRSFINCILQQISLECLNRRELHGQHRNNAWER